MQYVTKILAVTFIAMLVWLSVEGATRNQHTISINVRFVSPSGQNVIISPASQSVNLTIRCATSQLARVKELASEPLEIEVNANDPQPLVLAPKITSHPRVARLGVSVERLDPETAPLTVQSIESITMRIDLQTPADLELTAPPTFNIEQANVTLPSGNATQAAEFKLIARLDQTALTGVVPGVPQTREVNLSLPPAMSQWKNVNFGPQKVQVTFTVKKKEDELLLPIVPVYLYIQPQANGAYDIKVEADQLVITDVKLRGPSDAIERIRSKQFKVEAALRLEAADLENAVKSKLPELKLPPGVALESAAPSIKLTITRREATGTN